MNTYALTERQTQAVKTLLAYSGLGHHPMIAKHTDRDANAFDFEALADFRWSSGEIVLLSVLRSIVTGYGEIEYRGLSNNLDESNRGAVILALSIALGVREVTA